MPDVRASDPNPDDLTPEEEAAEPGEPHDVPDDVTESPEEQTGG